MALCSNLIHIVNAGSVSATYEVASSASDFRCNSRYLGHLVSLLNRLRRGYKWKLTIVSHTVELRKIAAPNDGGGEMPKLN